MAVLLEKTASYIFNSDPASGAQNVSADGSVFQVSLNYPIAIPKGAVDCSAAIIQAAIWNTSYNIAAAFGNNKFKFTTTVAPAGTYTLTIPDGLYSVAGLGSYLSSQFTNLTLPGSLIVIGGDSATQKSTVTFSTSGDSVDFTVANSVRAVLGFNSVVITAPSANYTFLSNNTASFNRNNSYIIASNLVSQGIPVNNQSQGIIGTVPISVSPGSQINYSPQNPVWFDCKELIGQPKINMQFNLVNQDLQPTPTAGEFYSFVVLFKYHLLLSTGSLPLKPP